MSVYVTTATIGPISLVAGTPGTYVTGLVVAFTGPQGPPGPPGDANIADGSITTAKLANLAVTTEKLADRSVTAAKLFQVGHEKIIGRHGAGAGDAQEVGIDGGLEFHGGNIRRSALTGDVTASAGGNALTITPAADPSWITALAWAKLTGVPDFVPKQRYRTLWVGAGAMTPPGTGGAAPSVVQTPSNGVTYDVFKFDGATLESVWVSVRMPDEWDRGTVKAVLYWEPDPSGTGAVVWGVAGVADSDNDVIDTALGSEVTVADSVLAVGRLHVTAATAAITIGGSPALGDVIAFRVRRIPTDAGDTMTQDACLLGVAIQWREGTTEPAAW